MGYFENRLEDDQNNRENMYGDDSPHQVKAQWIANQLPCINPKELDEIELMVKGFIHAETLAVLDYEEYCHFGNLDDRW